MVIGLSKRLLGSAALFTTLFGCAQVTPHYQYIATSNPAGAMIYKGSSPDNLSYYLTTPYFGATPSSLGWSQQYFLARKPGYKDSQIFQQPISGYISRIHFDLTPLDPTESQNTPQPLKKSKKISAPKPIPDNSGNYMSPFTSTGNVAVWAQRREATTDNGSDVAGAAGGAVGKYAADKALGFVPFGLGGLIGSKAGDSLARSATKKTTAAPTPTAAEAKAGSDLSFNSVDDLAVYMYVKHSAHQDYSRILGIAQQVYPELQTRYKTAIENAVKTTALVSAETETNDTSDAKDTHTTINSKKNKESKRTNKERLKELQQLKKEGFISEDEYNTKKTEIIKSI